MTTDSAYTKLLDAVHERRRQGLDVNRIRVNPEMASTLEDDGKFVEVRQEHGVPVDTDVFDIVLDEDLDEPAVAESVVSE